MIRRQRTDRRPIQSTTQPAKTAKIAALRAAYAFATADKAVLDDVIHWPTLRKRMGDKVPADVTLKRFHDAMLQQLVVTIRDPKPADEVRPVLLGVLNELKERPTDTGCIRVTLPARFKNAWYDVVLVEGVYHLVGWPGI